MKKQPKKLFTYEYGCHREEIDGTRIGWCKTMKQAFAAAQQSMEMQKYDRIWIKRRDRRSDDFNY